MADFKVGDRIVSFGYSGKHCGQTGTIINIIEKMPRVWIQWDSDRTKTRLGFNMMRHADWNTENNG